MARPRAPLGRDHGSVLSARRHHLEHERITEPLFGAAGLHTGSCFLWALLSRPSEAKLDESCLAIDKHRKNYLLLGDSHAAHLVAGLNTAFPSVHFLQANAVGCKPVFLGEDATACRSLMESLLARYAMRSDIDAILLSAAWDAADLGPLRDTVQRLRAAGRRVFVFGPSVDYQISLPRLLALSLERRDPSVISRARLPQTADLDRSFADAFRGSGATYVSVYRTMCDARDCVTTTLRGAPVQFDTNHLTPDGSTWVAMHWRKLGLLR